MLTSENDCQAIVDHLLSPEVGVTQLSELAQINSLDVLPESVQIPWIKRKPLLDAFAKCASGEQVSFATYI